MKRDDEARFAAVAEARRPALRRTAVVLCGDWHLADDLVQRTVIKLFLAWPLRDETAVDAWLTRTLTRTFIDDTRRSWWKRERTTSEPPDWPAPEGVEPGIDQELMRRLDELAPAQRACIVLRFLLDLSPEQTAAALGCSAGTVRSQTSRGLALLRDRMTPEMTPDLTTKDAT